MNGTRRATVIGTVALDLVAASADEPTARAAAGNSGANIAIRLADAGWEVEMVGLVGPDSAGALIGEDLQRWGVRTTGLVARHGYRSPRVFQVTGGADRGSASLSSDCPRCGRARGHRLKIPDPDELPAAIWDWAARSQLLVADVVGESSNRLAGQASGLIWYEASLREAAPARIAEFADHSHVVKYSAEESDVYRDVLLASRGSSRVRIVTDGPRGVRYQARPSHHGRPWSPWHTLPAELRGRPVDTIGAGDAFTAAAAGHLAADPDAVHDAITAGNRAAARACLSEGARGDMLTSGDAPEPWVRTGVAFQCGRCDLQHSAREDAADDRRA